MNDLERAALRPLARRFRGPDAALAEIARLSAELTLPKGAVHIVSDVHGEDVKLRHVVNNASGTLRPLVERLFGERMTKAELQDFLALVFYPREMLERLEPELADPARRQAFARRVLPDLYTLVHALAARYTLPHLDRLLPEEYAELLREMLYGPARDPAYRGAII
ncbi:MAG TPA: fructose-bisphosphatase class III, partial [Vicinamibacteria bacterium]|nr:fructose-bisphosphatase class III [Vicinamibacteria bacterium]